MNWAQGHLLLNHFPIIGAVFGILLLALALVKPSRDLQRASLGFFILLALLALPAYFTGRLAVKHVPAGSESFIDRHEAAALIALVAVEIQGVLGLGGLTLSRRSRTIPTWLTMTLLLLSIAVGGWMARGTSPTL